MGAFHSPKLSGQKYPDFLDPFPGNIRTIRAHIIVCLADSNSFVLFVSQPYHRCISFQKARTTNMYFKGKEERCVVQLL